MQLVGPEPDSPVVSISVNEIHQRSDSADKYWDSSHVGDSFEHVVRIN